MIVRASTPDDLGFILETFARSFRAASTHAEGLSKEQVSRLVTNLLARGWAASVCEDEEMIIGWAIHGGPGASFDVRDPAFKMNLNHLAWFYVRDLFRGQGVGKYLLKWANVDTSKAITSPFLPNREPRRFRINHRPFECLP